MWQAFTITGLAMLLGYALWRCSTDAVDRSSIKEVKWEDYRGCRDKDRWEM